MTEHNNATAEKSKKDPKSKDKLWKNYAMVGMTTAFIGITIIGADIYRAVTIEKPEFSEEYITTREKLSQLEADEKTLNTNLIANYPITANAEMLNYNNARTDILKENESAREVASQKLSELETDKTLLTQYEKNRLPSRYSTIGLVLTSLGVLGAGFSLFKSGKWFLATLSE